ncbi:tetratricopeptide repeat protein [Brevibacillus halotolerans]|nr:tetratricopeptide repeat protein [Brevibacillus halotolerans]
MNKNEQERRGVITSFQQDANFFANWGMRSLQRNNFAKALQCFERALEIEPANAVHYCNKASVLAEMGKFEDSNDILYSIIEKIDSSLVDVYFFLANNYANMDDFEMAADMAVKYLTCEADGIYAEEAQELLHYIYFELDLPPRNPLEPQEDETVVIQHEKARKKLEEGKFMQAVDCLNSLVKEYPDFMPAWNNLALAYYYIGDFNKAMDTIELALEKDPGNLHAICNMAVLLSHHNKWAELVPIITRLKKIQPFHYDHMYKLATTMGVLGQHDDACRLYQKILRQPVLHDVSTYHYAATSAYLSERYHLAMKWWKKVQQMDPDAGIAQYYLEKAKSALHGMPKENIPYHYHHPQREIEMNQAPITAQDFKYNPMVRASMLWALQHGKEESKETVIRTLAMIGDSEAISTLEYYIDITNNEELKEIALAALEELQTRMEPENSGGPTLKEVTSASNEWSEENITTLHQRGQSEESSLDLSTSTDKQSITDEVEFIITEQLSSPANHEKREWMIHQWKYYISQKEQIQVRKLEAWAAALDYLYERSKGTHKISQNSIAEQYGVSKSTLTKCLRALSYID